MRISHANRIYDNLKKYYTAEVQMINLFNENGITPIEIIKTIDGLSVESVESIEGKRFIVLTRELLSEDDVKWNSEHWQQFGTKLAEIHSLTKDTTLKRPKFDLNQFEKFAEAIVSYFGSESMESLGFKNNLNSLKSSFELLQSLSPIGVVHGDYTSLNVVIYDGELQIIDFDYSWIGPQWLDILNTTFVARKYYGENGLEIIDNFLAGYQQVSKLSASFLDEIERLKILVNMYYMGIWSSKINTFGKSFIGNNLENAMKVILEMQK
jgi:Ser/Thr protein kinase RdoA (MazF antagonist)